MDYATEAGDLLRRLLDEQLRPPRSDFEVTDDPPDRAELARRLLRVLRAHVEVYEHVLTETARRFTDDGTLPVAATCVELGIAPSTFYKRKAAQPPCEVCGQSRRLDDPDPLADVIAHAQCDQIVAHLDEELSHA